MRKRINRLFRLLVPRKGRGGAFARNERGAVLIEFAILALPFFTLIYAILETSIVFLTGQILDGAVNDASRMVRTGQAQTAGWDIDDFREEMCGRLYGLFDCSQLRIKVSVVSTFQSAAIEEPVGEDCLPDGSEDDCEWLIDEAYAAGVGSEVVLVQTYYKWPTIVNMPGFNLANMAGGKRMLSAVRVFKNEPF